MKGIPALLTLILMVALVGSPRIPFRGAPKPHVSQWTREMHVHNICKGLRQKTCNSYCGCSYEGDVGVDSILKVPGKCIEDPTTNPCSQEVQNDQKLLEVKEYMTKQY
jgi:hypothetical protein